jgi:nucleoside-diphosphate-sugar epimerase
MKILVYSASGLIGLNLLKHLQDNNPNVQLYIIHDRSIPKNFFTLLGINAKNLIRLTNLDRINIKFDEIYHCGFSSQPSVFITNINRTIDKNVLITPVLINSLTESGAIFYMSTSEIYSGCSLFPCDETHLGDLSKMGNRITYVLSKLLTEKLIEKLSGPKQRYYLLRVSLVYGPGVFLDDARVMYSFIREALYGNIIIKGSQSPIRNYLYIDDFVAAMLKLRSKNSGIYNIGGEAPVSIGDLAKLVSNFCQSDIQFSNQGENSVILSAPDMVHLSMSKLKQNIDFQPKTDLSSGVQKVIEWFKLINS